MIVAISRFAVKNGKEAEVRSAFENRPRRVEDADGFLGLEVFQEGATFVLLTRWCDEGAFRAWHDSAEHHASHALIPKGLKLDPSMTQLVVGTRIAGASSESPEGELLSDLSAPIARLMRDGSIMHVAVIDAGGQATYANAAFVRACGGEIVGRTLDSVLTAGSHRALMDHVAQDLRTPLIVQIAPAQGDPCSLRVFTRRMSSGFALVGEPPWDDHRALEQQLIALNAELSVLSREHARQARLLEKVNRDMNESHWHLKKISEVLPMCMTCRAVKTGDQTWEDVSSFLARTTDFLSHGYCARCAEAMAVAPISEEP